jgi:hypothetical protein
LEQIRTGQCNLIEWLEGLVEAHGHAIAQTCVASGEPDDQPRELTFAEFVARVRRCSKALATLRVSPQEVVAFAGALSETSCPMMIAAMTTATFSPINYFLEAESVEPHCQRKRGNDIAGALPPRRRTRNHRQAQASSRRAPAFAFGQLRWAETEALMAEAAR